MEPAVPTDHRASEFLWVNADEIDLEKARSAFRTQGIFFVRNLLPNESLAELLREIEIALRYLLKIKDISFSPDATLDDLCNRAYSRLGDERKYLSTIGADLSSYWALVGHERLRDFLKRFFLSESLQTVADSNVLRIDRPGDDSTILTWHQDFPYNVLDENACTVWAPLRPVSRDMGRMLVIPGDLRIRNVDLKVEEKGKFHSSGYFRLSGLDAEAEAFESKAIELPNVGVGDAVISHSLLLHASGKNRSENRSRWVFTARYASTESEKSASRLWLTARAKYPFFFAEAYPEHVSRG